MRVTKVVRTKTMALRTLMGILAQTIGRIRIGVAVMTTTISPPMTCVALVVEAPLFAMKTCFKSPSAMAKKKGYTKNGWKVEETCEKDNAYAKIWKKGDMLAVSFDGSDDIWDWTNNLQLWKEGGYHSGFLKHVNKVKSCLDWNVSKHGGEVHYYVGHSLGGAAATIYYDLANNHARDAQVITVGAPKTHVASGCDIPGIRYADTRDPVASNVFRLMSNYNHRIETAKFYKDMTVRNWWSWNRHSDWRWVSVGCAEETNAGWLLDTAYYALKRHTSKNYLSEELKGC